MKTMYAHKPLLMSAVLIRVPQVSVKARVHRVLERWPGKWLSLTVIFLL